MGTTALSDGRFPLICNIFIKGLLSAGHCGINQNQTRDKTDLFCLSDQVAHGFQGGIRDVKKNIPFDMKRGCSGVIGHLGLEASDSASLEERKSALWNQSDTL